MADNAADADRLIGFTIAERSARGRLVRLGPALNDILAAHAYPEPVARLLAQALVLTALLGALFRPEEGQLTLQARGEGGPVKLLVTDFKQWDLRGYAAIDLDRRFAPMPGSAPNSLEALLGHGHLALTLDQMASAERYQGIVELGGSTLEEAARQYFENSEQLPTLVRLVADRLPDGSWQAGGLILQHLARSEAGSSRLHVDSETEYRAPEAGETESETSFNGAHDDWAHVAVLAGSVTADELLDGGLLLEDLLWRLFNEDEVRILPSESLKKGCRCSLDHIRTVLAQFPEDERASMRNQQGVILVDCEFCAKQFPVNL